MGGRGCVTSGDVTSCFSVACAAILSTWTVWIGPSFTRRPAKLRSCGPKRKHRNCGIFRQNSANLRGYARLRRGNRQVGDRSPGLSAWLVRKSNAYPRGTRSPPAQVRWPGPRRHDRPAPSPSEARQPGARPAGGRSPLHARRPGCGPAGNRLPAPGPCREPAPSGTAKVATPSGPPTGVRPLRNAKASRPRLGP